MERLTSNLELFIAEGQVVSTADVETILHEMNYIKSHLVKLTAELETEDIVEEQEELSEAMRENKVQGVSADEPSIEPAE